MDDDTAALERFRIHELIGRYVDALTHRDWDVYRELDGDAAAPIAPGHLVPKPGPGVGF